MENEIHANIRQLKIALITDSPNHFIDTFNKITLGLKSMQIKDMYNNDIEIIYYVNTNYILKALFSYNITKNIFTCDYNDFWSYFTKHRINYDDIQGVVQLLIENRLNKSIPVPESGYVGVNQVKDRLFRIRSSY